MSEGEEVACHGVAMDAAREWYLRLETSEGDDAVQESFNQWLSENSEHQVAFDQVVDFWAQIETLPQVEVLHEEGEPMEAFQSNKGPDS